MRSIALCLLAFAAIATLGCAEGRGHDHDHAHAHGNPHAGYAGVEQAVAVMQPTAGNAVGGTVVLTATDDGVHVVADITGLAPNGTHAIHIHEFGDARADDGTSAGGHYNPAGHDHGLPDAEHRHAGDLGNLEADADGNARYELTVDNMSLHGSHPVLGRSVIIHADADDGGQPTGNAGPRIAIGVIGVAHPDFE